MWLIQIIIESRYLIHHLNTWVLWEQQVRVDWALMNFATHTTWKLDQEVKFTLQIQKIVVFGFSALTLRFR